MDQPQPDLEATKVLTRRRLHDALAAARSDLFTPTDPDTLAQRAAHPALQLTQEEREAIRRALTRSPRLLAGYATRLLKIYDTLGAQARSEALDLFTYLVHNPHPVSLTLGAPRELER